MLVITFNIEVVTVSDGALKQHSDRERQLGVTWILKRGHVKELVGLFPHGEVLEDVSEGVSSSFYHLYRLKVITEIRS